MRSLVLTTALVALAGTGCRKATEPKAEPTPAARAVEWVRIAPGAFEMGSPNSEFCRGPDEGLSAEQIPHAIWAASREVTQAEFERRMGSNPSFHEGCEDCPVDSVTFDEAARYCSLLSAEEGYQDCYRCREIEGEPSCEPAVQGPLCAGFRLPSEREWEYLARAGTKTATYAGPLTSCMSRDEAVDQIGWYKANSAGYTHPVGSKRANDWGLHDLAGNVYEWTEELVDRQGDASSDDTAEARFRVLRGGSWFHNAHHTRSASRLRAPSNRRFSYAGFRCIRTELAEAG